MPFALDPVFINAILVIFLGSRFPRSEDAQLRKVGKSAMRLQRSCDATGGLLTMYSWLKWAFPKLSGYYDGIRGAHSVRDFLKVYYIFIKSTLLIKFGLNINVILKN